MWCSCLHALFQTEPAWKHPFSEAGEPLSSLVAAVPALDVKTKHPGTVTESRGLRSHLNTLSGGVKVEELGCWDLTILGDQWVVSGPNLGSRREGQGRTHQVLITHAVTSWNTDFVSEAGLGLMYSAFLTSFGMPRLLVHRPHFESQDLGCFQKGEGPWCGRGALNLESW